MIPVSYADQIVPGTFEDALDDIVENHLDMSIFDKRYRNDQTGRLAYDPKALLKIDAHGGTRLSSPRFAFASRAGATRR